MDFKTYQYLVEKYYKNDCRELNFQNRVLIPFLESLIPEDYDIVDTSTLYKNWKKINRDSFAKQYTPDVLVTQNWSLFEAKQDPQIIIEVKRPTANDRTHADNEISEYKNNANYVILTDCITWEIHKKNMKPTPFYLSEKHEGVCKHTIPKTKEERTIKWIDSTVAENDWDKLRNTIIDMILKKQ